MILFSCFKLPYFNFLSDDTQSSGSCDMDLSQSDKYQKPFEYFYNQNQTQISYFQCFPTIFNICTTPQYTTQPNFDTKIGDTFVKTQQTQQIQQTQDTKFNNKEIQVENNTEINLNWWKQQGYNEEKGKKLAASTKKHSDYLHRKGFLSRCGRGVREGINDAFYNGEEHHKPQRLAAKVFGDKYFAYDDNLKKINVKGMNLNKYDIPEGAIVIYEKYSNNPAGHIEVSDGNGHGYSNFTSTLLQNHGVRREPKEIWIPV